MTAGCRREGIGQTRANNGTNVNNAVVQGFVRVDRQTSPHRVLKDCKSHVAVWFLDLMWLNVAELHID